VQLDWARAEKWPPYWFGDNFKAYGWMEDVWWTYRAKLNATSVPNGQRLIFACGGIDYQFTVLFDGVVLHAQEGMFTPFELDLTKFAAGGGILEIRLNPAPKAPSTALDRTQARLSAKPPVAYTWDWHPRLIPLGIWESTALEFRPSIRLTTTEVSYALDPEARSAEIEVLFAATQPVSEGQWAWRLVASSGELVASGNGPLLGATVSSRAHVDNLALWWPHDQGAQPLYTITVELLDARGGVLDRRSRRIGFRRARLVMHEGAWSEPSTFPKSRSHPPMTLEINGRVIFCRGSNWVPPEIFPGIINRETYRALLVLAKEANFNLLRNWGGGIVNKEDFFELCDELGLMVWQEFPLACNLYEDDPHYLQVLDQESRSIIARVRRHPSLVMWSGAMSCSIRGRA
jgi:beta-mannosidase